jgi:hypothetical protein
LNDFYAAWETGRKEAGLSIKNTTFIFVIGAPRSGTTWLHQMIAEHQDVVSLNGSNTFLHGYILPLEDRYYKEKRYFTDRGVTRGLPAKLNESEFRQLLDDYIARFYNFLSANQKYYVEKATDITAELARIKKYIPHSKFIHIIRDGRNRAVSEIKYHKKHGIPFGISDTFEGAVNWKRQIEEARRTAAAFQNDVLEIRYEDLLVRPVHYLEVIFRHMGLDAGQQELERIAAKFNYTVKPVSDPTSSVLSAQGNPEQAYEKEMSIIEQAMFEYAAGDLLDSFGYARKHLLDNALFYMYVKYGALPAYHLKKRARRLWPVSPVIHILHRIKKKLLG